MTPTPPAQNLEVNCKLAGHILNLGPGVILAFFCFSALRCHPHKSHWFATALVAELMLTPLADDLMML